MGFTGCEIAALLKPFMERSSIVGLKVVSRNFLWNFISQGGGLYIHGATVTFVNTQIHDNIGSWVRYARERNPFPEVSSNALLSRCLSLEVAPLKVVSRNHFFGIK